LSIFEISGFVTGIAGIWLTIRQNVWCFPVGLINVTVSLFLFIDEKLYSDALQQVFYMVLLSYGWYKWTTSKNENPLKVTELTAQTLFLYLVFATLIAGAMGYFFDQFTDAHVPYMDASATALSFLAQFLIAKKKIENWSIWIVVNVMYIGIYLYKDLYLYAGLFAIYLLLAVNGLMTWRKAMNEEIKHE